MNTTRRPWLNGVILLTSLAGLVSGAAEKNDQAPTDFCAYYTNLDYTQPPSPPEMLGRIPVNAARALAGSTPDRASHLTWPSGWSWSPPPPSR